MMFSSPSIQRGLKVILGCQAIVAVMLVASDINARWNLDRAFDRSPAKITGPITPGDQVRHYEPSRTLPELGDPTVVPSIDLPADLPEQLSFSVHQDAELGDFLLLLGPITTGDADRLEAYLRALDVVPATVALHSPGGIVDEALQIGRGLRDKALSTMILPGMICMSSCPYVLAAGVDRHVSLRGAVGLHQHYYDAPGYMPVFFAVESIQRNQGRTMSYLIEMGIDPGVMVYGLQTSPDDIYILVEPELRESQIATEILP